MFIGLGSLGSAVLQNLLGMGIGSIIGIDGDCIETSNLSRQSFYFYSDIGKFKVKAAKEKIANFTPYTKFFAIPEYIDSSHRIHDIVESVGIIPKLIILTADSPSFDIVKWVLKFAEELRIPVIRGNRDTIGPITIPKQTACPYCDWSEVRNKIPELEYIISYRKSNAFSAPGIIPSTLSLLGACMADEIVKFIVNVQGQTLLNKKLKLCQSEHFKNFRCKKMYFDPNCFICS